jgi:DNA (cytosine-5)-methyltransferase 1
MNYLSVCSGIEAATVAWHDLGWNALGYSEIEKFPSEVLKHHYPDVPNLGDMTKYKEWDFGTNRLGLLVGGTPCQSFSVAGLRKGLEDPRGNLALTYVGILDKFRPKWCIWENVPGVLSSNKGRDFGAFLGALVELRYGFAYRVLDAQNFGVAQRRRRVFVVGCSTGWESAAKVLFESESLSGNYSQSRGARKSIATTTERSLAYGGSDPECADTVTSKWAKGSGGPSGNECGLFVAHKVYETHPADSRVKEMGDTCQTVTSRWGTGGGNVPLVQSYGFEPGIVKREGNPSRFSEEMSPTLRAEMGDNQVAVAYSIREDAKANNFSATPLEVTPALQATRPSVQSHHAQTFVAHTFKVRGGCEGGGKGYLGQDEAAFTISCNQDQQLFHNMAVRRLTPTECERLQGFPDDYTNIKDNCPDSPRYKALGNSMAVPVMKWIGERIQMVENK